MDENRNNDKAIMYCSPHDPAKRMSLEQIKSLYIASGKTEQEIAELVDIDVAVVCAIVDEAKLPELRKAYIREGVAKIQNEQLGQAQKLMDIELNFKKLRISQLEKQLEDFMAYYARHGDFYKRHPISGEILCDTDRIPMQIHIPNVANEIRNLKESVTLSEGLKKLLSDLDDIINGKKQGETVGDDPNVIDLDSLDGLFQKRS